MAASVYSADARVLAAMGYESQLSRGIRGWLSSAAITFVGMGAIPTAFALPPELGGPEVAILTYIIASFFSVITLCALAEVRNRVGCPVKLNGAGCIPT